MEWLLIIVAAGIGVYFWLKTQEWKDVAEKKFSKLESAVEFMLSEQQRNRALFDEWRGEIKKLFDDLVK